MACWCKTTSPFSAGPTVHAALARYEFTPPTGPLGLQDHGDAVRYRNVWLRPLGTSEAKP